MEIDEASVKCGAHIPLPKIEQDLSCKNYFENKSFTSIDLNIFSHHNKNKKQAACES